MVTVCQRCGDRGFSVALIYCDECQANAVHRYCLDVLPKIFDEYVLWLCYHCELKLAKSTSPMKMSSPIDAETDSDSFKSIQQKKRNPLKRPEGKSKAEVVDCSSTNSHLLRPQISSHFQLVEVHCSEDDGKDQKLNDEKDQKLGRKNSLEESSFQETESLRNKDSQLIVCDVQPLQVHHCEDEKKSQKVGRQNDLNEGSFVEEEELDKTKKCPGDAPCFTKQSCPISVVPVRDPIWRGSMSIFQKNFGAPGGIVAHLSSIACSRASEEAKRLPTLLSPELLPRSEAWPKSFQKLAPTADHIGLYFFPDNERNEIVFDSLVNDMISQDLAMRVVLESAELLIYTSRKLPLDCWRFQSKLYLWGLFRPKKPSAVAIGGVPEKKKRPRTGRNMGGAESC